jgi:hypothetical protein
MQSRRVRSCQATMSLERKSSNALAASFKQQNQILPQHKLLHFTLISPITSISQDIGPIQAPTQVKAKYQTHPPINGAPTLRRRQGRPRVHTTFPTPCILAIQPYHRKHGILRDLTRKHTTIKPGTLSMVRLHIRPAHINDDE